ncbi:MAG: hypothetical protein C0593_07355 [Marinilabiliales bacterium]|nr:MAG: hypothetical protein C0593_07355 [Marinilabiliales bacterium]
MKVLTFGNSDITFAIPVQEVNRVIEIVAIQNLPDTPAYISGFFELANNAIPVIDIGHFFTLKTREPELSDKFIIVSAHQAPIALWVEKVSELMDINDEIIATNKELAYLGEKVKGVIKNQKNLIIICDTQQFLERSQLDDLFKKIEESKTPLAEAN